MGLDREDLMPAVKPGRYRHYKGNEYEVMGIARHSETLEELVVYKALYDDEGSGESTVWVRPKEMFLEEVEAGGRKMPRFERLGE